MIVSPPSILVGLCRPKCRIISATESATNANRSASPYRIVQNHRLLAAPQQIIELRPALGIEYRDLTILGPPGNPGRDG